MPYVSFVRDNARWLAGAFLLTFFSSYGQTFFISLSAGDIRAEYGLSHGEFGLVYMLATLASAFTLPYLGQIVDRRSPRQVTLLIVPVLALGCVVMALAQHLAVLLAALYLLRLFGQGMMSQNAFTAVGRWFAAQRGKATSIAAIGLNAGEALFPLLFVLVVGLVGWRNAWLVAAATLMVLALPVISRLVALEREPGDGDAASPASGARDWTRAEVLRDPLFYLTMAGVMAPPFIGTTIFFHQVHLVELRGWSLEAFAASFTLMAGAVVVCSLIAGQLVDRFSARAMLPFFLVPLGLACLTLGFGEAQASAFVFMALLGLSYGLSSTMFSALWPEVYGLAHLGAIRAMTVAIAVFATAAGPGLTGFLIDGGIAFPAQVVVMGIYCLVLCFVMVVVSRRLKARALQPAWASATGTP